MGQAAYTPEELEEFLEDAFVIGNSDAVAALFGETGVLAIGVTPPARGRSAIAEAAEAFWTRNGTHLAGGEILQARDTALVISPAALTVMRRDPQRRWRYEIVHIRGAETASRDPAPYLPESRLRLEPAHKGKSQAATRT